MNKLEKIMKEAANWLINLNVSVEEQAKIKKYLDALWWSVPHEIIRKGIEYTTTRDLPRHYAIIKEIEDVMNVSIENPDILIIDYKVGLTSFDIESFVITSSRTRMIAPLFIISKECESNELALKGFYAHELAHLALMRNEKHEEYVERNKWNNEDEKAVDDYASAHGFKAEIEAQRKIYPLR